MIKIYLKNRTSGRVKRKITRGRRALVEKVKYEGKKEKELQSDKKKGK
jgi:hypothetical protein